jgi:hypothetical protein
VRCATGRSGRRRADVTGIERHTHPQGVGLRDLEYRRPCRHRLPGGAVDSRDDARKWRGERDRAASADREPIEGGQPQSGGVACGRGDGVSRPRLLDRPRAGGSFAEQAFEPAQPARGLVESRGRLLDFSIGLRAVVTLGGLKGYELEDHLPGIRASDGGAATGTGRKRPRDRRGHHHSSSGRHHRFATDRACLLDRLQ